MTAWQTVELQNSWTAELTVPLSLSLPPFSLFLSPLMFIMKSVPFWTASCILVFIYFCFIFFILWFLWERGLSCEFYFPSRSLAVFVYFCQGGGQCRGRGWGEEALIMSAAATAAAVALNALIKDATTTTTSRTARQQQQQRSLRSTCRRAKLAQLQL